MKSDVRIWKFEETYTEYVDEHFQIGSEEFARFGSYLRETPYWLR